MPCPSSWLPEWVCHATLAWLILTADCGDNAAVADTIRAMPVQRWEQLHHDFREFAKRPDTLFNYDHNTGFPEFINDLSPLHLRFSREYGKGGIQLSGCFDNKVMLYFDTKGGANYPPQIYLIPGEMRPREILWQAETPAR